MDYQSAIQLITKERKIIASPSSLIGLWSKWYRGKVPSFHRYYVYNGQKKIYRERLSMKMAKQVCEDWASLLMNEKVKIVVSDQEQMDKLLIDLDFWNKANESVEKGFALSMCAIVVNVSGLEIEVDPVTQVGTLKSTDKSYIELSTHTASHLVPITWENGACTECGFVTEDTDKTIITVHMKDEKGEYVICTHTIYKNSKKENETTFFHTGSNIQWFALIYPRITNNLEVDSPLPISIFGNAIDTLKAIDTKYDSYNVEFAQGKKRTYISAKMQEVDPETGNVRNTFDPDDTMVYSLPEGTSVNGEEKPVIINVTDTLRTAEHSQAIQDELNFLSKQVGLGVDYYRFEKGRVMTATQVISEKSDTFRNMKKHEGVLEKAIITLMRAIMYASNEFTNIKFQKPEEVEVQFDDSVIEDKATEKENDRKDVESGVMSKLEFRMKWYGENKETAIENLKGSYGDVELVSRINTLLPALQSGAISITQFVKLVYTNLTPAEQNEMIEELNQRDSIGIEDVMGGYTPTKEE